LRFASNGVVAVDGMAIDQAVFASPMPLGDGFMAIEDHLKERGRPLDALCGVELRLPAALTLDGFVSFNDRYLAQLDRWGLVAGNAVPLARTNVSPYSAAPLEPAVLAFSFTEPDARSARDLVVSGIAELPIGAGFPEGIVRRGETDDASIRAKLDCVVEAVKAHIAALGTEWLPSDEVNLYSRHASAAVLADAVLAEAGLSPVHGLRWHRASPPVKELELEIDVRRYRAVHRLPAR
jgi:hypothetical protein